MSVAIAGAAGPLSAVSTRAAQDLIERLPYQNAVLGPVRAEVR